MGKHLFEQSCTRREKRNCGTNRVQMLYADGMTSRLGVCGVGMLGPRNFGVFFKCHFSLPILTWMSTVGYNGRDHSGQDATWEGSMPHTDKGASCRDLKSMIM